MACTSTASPLSALSKHLQTYSATPPASSLSAHLNLVSTASFRTLGASSSADRDLDAFARASSSATCQVEALPPYCTASTTMQGGDRRLPPNPHELPSSTVNVDNAAASPYWAPEQETLHALSSSPASSISSLLSRRYSVPDEDEAASICSTPPTSCGASIHVLSKTTSRSHLTSEGSGEAASTPAAHPLTLFPPSHTAWDFDRLFSRRRRWFGGVRVPGDTIPLDTAFTNDEDHQTAQEGERGRPLVAKVMMDRAERKDRQVSAERRMNRRSVSGSRLRPCEDGGPPSCTSCSGGVAALPGGPGTGEEVSSSLGTVVEEQEKRERQREAFEQLRQCAMTRLEAVGRHLEWKP